MALKDLAKLINKANKEKTPAQEFQRMYNETRVRLDKPYIPSKTYKPSSLGGCLRNCYFQMIGAPLDKGLKKDVQLMEMGDTGTDRHERIQRVIAKMEYYGYDCEWIDVEDYLKDWPVAGSKVVSNDGMETKVYNSVLNLSFKCDGLIRFMGELYILEIKTEISFKFMGRSGCADDHRVQGTCYCAALGVDKVLFFYENRDNLAKKTYVIDVTPQEIEQRVLIPIEQCNSYIEENQAPPKTDVIKNCTYCSYKQECAKW